MLLVTKNAQKREYNISISVTYNRTLPKIKSIVEKHCFILQVNLELKKIPYAWPLIFFHENANLKQIIGSNETDHNNQIKQ